MEEGVISTFGFEIELAFVARGAGAVFGHFC